MNLISIIIILASSLISGVIGFLMASLASSPSRKPVAPLTEAAPVADATQVQTEKQLKVLVDSLCALTSQVDTQVGEHSLRVTEITTSLESPDPTGPSMVLAAGKLLVSANQKLQADLEEAKSEIKRQQETVNACMRESRTDALTNLANRRAFDIEMARAFAQRRRSGQPFSLVIIDIDHFKRINDQYGHMVGDQLLKAFSRCLTNTFREYDFVARYGGEEFSAILSKTPLAEALKAAERVRAAIADNRIRVGDLEIQITASIGIKEVQPNETEAELIERTDAALYAAKKAGRNRCYYHNGTEIHLSQPELKAEGSEAELAISQAETAASGQQAVTAPPSNKPIRKPAGIGSVDKPVHV